MFFSENHRKNSLGKLSRWSFDRADIFTIYKEFVILLNIPQFSLIFLLKINSYNIDESVPYILA